MLGGRRGDQHYKHQTITTMMAMCFSYALLLERGAMRWRHALNTMPCHALGLVYTFRLSGVAQA